MVFLARFSSMPMSQRNLQRMVLLPAALVWLASPLGADEPPSFEKDARPILKAYCFDCHGAAERLKGGLDLRLRRFLADGGDSGAAIVPGNPAGSLLIQRLKSGQMPPGEKKVPAKEIAVLEKWVASGAKVLRAEPEKLPLGFDITPEERAYWFYQPVRRIDPPAARSAERARTPIDRFLLVKLREKKLGFQPDADRRTLIRRASLDLLGLLPSEKDIREFLDDPSPDAYEKMLDRLLASPQYGERWARHWLDVAGYADSDGNGNQDTPRPFAYKYRDWVVRALDRDLPLDRFLIEQIAGDELVPRPWNNLTPAQAEMLAATGFLRMVPDATAGTGGEARTMAANQVVTETLKTFSSAVLGLTVGCAQCHDHRYDPISQVDYFRLRAVFEPALDPSRWREPGQRRVSLYTDADRAKAAAIDAEVAKMRAALEPQRTKLIHAAVDRELAKFPEPKREQLRQAYYAAKRTPEQTKLLAAHPSVNITAGVLYQYDPKAADFLKGEEKKIAAKAAEKPFQDFVDVLDETPGAVPKTHLHHRGDPRQPKQVVGPGDLTIAAADGNRLELPEQDGKLPTTGRRLAYARHLTSGRHPFVGRVLANRIWLHHFGRGLVDTPGDFGVLGLKPTHPELLDWLADELVRQGWSLKKMHRLIMTSTAYRQASRREGPSADADDALYPRYPLRRLDAEVLRDCVLQVSGRLDGQRFGPPVAVEVDAAGQGVPAGNSARRSLYLQVRRSQPVSLLNAFDAPMMNPNCDRRTSTTAATQALMLMNGDFLLKHAEVLADRITREMPADFARDLAEAPELAGPEDPWSYGYGGLDPKDARTVRFTPLPYWTGSSWQGGKTLPDPKIDWALVTAAGGHPGQGPERAAIRRWTAPADGVAAIRGMLQHPAKVGDGVRGRIVSSRTGLLGEWHVHDRKQEFALDKIEVRRGDSIDFVAEAGATVTTDSFTWNARLEWTSGQEKRTWDSAADFKGPPGPALARRIAYAWQAVYQRPIAPEELALAARFAGGQLATLRREGTRGDHQRLVLVNLCQQLLSSNEFLYVD